MTSQNVALWDINIALWAIYLFIVTRIFHFMFQLALLSNELEFFLCGFRQNDLLWQLYPKNYNFTDLIVKTLLKSSNQLTSRNVALWDINIALWAHVSICSNKDFISSYII